MDLIKTNIFTMFVRKFSYGFGFSDMKPMDFIVSLKYMDKICKKTLITRY